MDRPCLTYVLFLRACCSMHSALLERTKESIHQRQKFSSSDKMTYRLQLSQTSITQLHYWSVVLRYTHSLGASPILSWKSLGTRRGP